MDTIIDLLTWFIVTPWTTGLGSWSLAIILSALIQGTIVIALLLGPFQ